MDRVTAKVLKMLEDDTIGAPESSTKVKPNGSDKDYISESKDHPIGDVSGKVKGPGTTGGGIEKDSQDKQSVPEAKKVTPHGMTDDMLRSLPNAMGRMARMGGVVEP